ncbi:MAG: Rha family transcriptional regulator [Clostridium sp.]|uniref:hypothetical protein n=1 Tax=Clostridium sp. TaxID=1506 RepID=UPI0025BB5D10|nr:hypothetical protein [Clostridium sp.]MCE5221864.1 Rha family transcriptional regulator [Clostridium sp.]
MENKLLTLTNDKELRITSVELVSIINDFRKLESGKTEKDYIELQHKSFITKIEKELEILKSLGLEDEQNILPMWYEDSYGRQQPCYQLNRDGMLQMLNSESVLVRYKTIEYINKLEYENEKLKEAQQLTLANEKIEKLEATVNKFERLTEEAKLQYKPSHKRKLDYSNMIKSLTNTREEYEIVKDWLFATLNIDKWEDTCIDDASRIIDIITTVSRLLTIKRFEQLKLF